MIEFFEGVAGIERTETDGNRRRLSPPTGEDSAGNA
jgi:hypothetical protein